MMWTVTTIRRTRARPSREVRRFHCLVYDMLINDNFASLNSIFVEYGPRDVLEDELEGDGQRQGEGEGAAGVRVGCG